MKGKPRLLIVSTTFPRWENDTGPAPFVFELALHLQRYFQVTVLAPHFKGSASHEVWKGLEVFRFKYLPEQWEFLSDGQGIQNHLRMRKSAYLALIPFCLAEFFSARKILRARRFDAVNSHWLIPSGLLLALLCRLFRINHFITVHAADYFLLTRIPLGKLIIRLLAKWSKALLPVNQMMADGIKSIWSNARIFVSPMGFDPQKFRKPEQEEIQRLRKEIAFEANQTLVFVGKLTEKKGVRNLIEAMKILEKDFPDLKLLIVGEGAERAELEKKVKAMGLEKNIKFLGAVPHQKVCLVYHLADAVVVPSMPDKSGESEGMPVVALEALASGRPVIGTVYCSVPAQLKQAGFVEIDESSPNVIAEAVRMVLKNGVCVETEKLDRYSWSEVARFYAEVIQG